MNKRTPDMRQELFDIVGSCLYALYDFLYEKEKGKTVINYTNTDIVYCAF